MRKILVFVCLFILNASLSAQDMYHEELVKYLSDNFGVANPSFVLFDNEVDNIEDGYDYGSITLQTLQSSNTDFSLYTNLQVNAVGNNHWDAGIGIRSKAMINAGDIILITFWAREQSEESDVFLFGEHSATFEKEVYNNFEFTPEWTQYFVVFKSNASYFGEGFSFGFHVAGRLQEIEIAGFTALNYGQNYTLADFPTSFSAANYEGSEADAPWRALAAARINSIRKADLNIKVKDEEGKPIEGANVNVEMQKHAFGFGSAFVSCRFPGNDCYDATYMSKLSDLDGAGHTFNVGVTENALKWDAWEEEWLGTPDETVSAIQWLADNGIKMRGHTLVWTGYQYMPDDIFENKDDLSYLRARLDERITEMVTHPVLSELITEWDVLNEITQNRDLENAFDSDLNFSTGREIYSEIFRKITELQPEHINYVNDYVVLSGGGSSDFVVNRYKDYLTELDDSGVKFDGIGFQCHIGSQPTSILKIQQVLDEFYQRFNKRMKITEYDIDGLVVENIQAKYLADFLTMIFSHPGVDEFIMWGFWDGNHWKDNAPLFYEDWSLKPSGQAFFDMVFDEWWTNESSLSDAEGDVVFRAFKGLHKVTVQYGDVMLEELIELEDDSVLEFTLEGTSSIDQQELKRINIYPNPSAQGSIRIEVPFYFDRLDLNIYDSKGTLVKPLQQEDLKKDIQLQSGSYLISGTVDTKPISQRIVIL